VTHPHSTATLQIPGGKGKGALIKDVWEWCHDVYQPHPKKTSKDNIIRYTYINNTNTHLLRGGSFFDLPVFVRSAYRLWNAPAYCHSNLGFRPSRTYY
jgi:formylglycine-generating enzyme required for sulfatase activity